MQQGSAVEVQKAHYSEQSNQLWISRHHVLDTLFSLSVVVFSPQNETKEHVSKHQTILQWGFILNFVKYLGYKFPYKLAWAIVQVPHISTTYD